MSMSNNQVDEPIACVRKKRRTKRNDVVANVIASSSHQGFSSRQLCQKSSKTSSKKLLEGKRTSLEEAAQKFSGNLCWLNKSPRSHSKRKGKEVVHQQEENNTMGFIDFFAQRENKGITICEKSVNSRSEEIAKTSNNNHSSSTGQILQFQDMANLYQVSLDYFLGNNSMKEMSSVWPRDHHNPRIIVHPSKIIAPSRFSQYYNQYMQRTTSVPAPINFSLMKLLLGVETLSDEELMYAKELLTAEDISSSEEQRVQQQIQAVNYQDMQGTSNFSYMRLLMEDEDSSILSEEVNENKLLTTQLSLSSSSSGGGQRVQQMSYMDLLTREDISYMDLLTREGISYMD